MDDGVLLDRGLRGLAQLHRLVGRHAGTVVELSGATGSIVPGAPDYPWLNALVCELGADARQVLERLAEMDVPDRLAFWACGAEQSAAAIEAGFTDLVARVPAMSLELDHIEASAGASEPIEPAEAGALSDAAYGNRGREVERTLATIPADCVRARGRRDDDGRIVAAAVLLDVDGDCSVQYVATRPDAQRRGHARALLSDALTEARVRGARTSSLQSSVAGLPLYRRLGYRTVGALELRRRAR